MTARRALLTGATGFLGSHLAHHLVRAGWEVHAVLRPASPTERLPASVLGHHYDGTTERMVEIVGVAAPDVVFHLASHFVAEHRTGDVTGMTESNLLLGIQLAEAMRLHERTRLVSTGSAWQHYLGEAYHPVNLYAAMKQAYVDVLRYFVEAAGLAVITLELFETYGPDDPRPKLMGALRRAALEGGRVALIDGRQRLGLVHVEDVTRAYEGAAERLLSGSARGLESYVVRADAAVSIRELVELFERVSGRPIEADWGARAYRPREVMDPWTGGETLPGWRPRVTLEQGIRGLLNPAAAVR